MKKAKKAALSLTLALAVSTAAVACADQGAVDDRTYRGAGQYQGRNMVNNYTIDTNDLNDRNRPGLMGRRDRTARGLFTAPGADNGYDNRLNNGRGGGLLFGGPGYRMDRNNGNGLFNGNNGNGLFNGNNGNGMFNGNNRNGLFDGGMGQAGDQQRLAQAIETRLLAIPGVQDCQVAVNGNDIVCGVNTANGQRDQVMNQVRQRLTNIAPNQNCYVTTDQNQIKRLGDINGDFQNGNATAQFRQLVDDIGERINPNR